MTKITQLAIHPGHARPWERWWWRLNIELWSNLDCTHSVFVVLYLLLVRLEAAAPYYKICFAIQCDQLSAYLAMTAMSQYIFFTIHWPHTKTSLPSHRDPFSKLNSSSSWLFVYSIYFYIIFMFSYLRLYYQTLRYIRVLYMCFCM